MSDLHLAVLNIMPNLPRHDVKHRPGHQRRGAYLESVFPNGKIPNVRQSMIFFINFFLTSLLQKLKLEQPSELMTEDECRKYVEQINPEFAKLSAKGKQLFVYLSGPVGTGKSGLLNMFALQSFTDMTPEYLFSSIPSAYVAARNSVTPKGRTFEAVVVATGKVYKSSHGCFYTAITEGLPNRKPGYRQIECLPTIIRSSRENSEENTS